MYPRYKKGDRVVFRRPVFYHDPEANYQDGTMWPQIGHTYTVTLVHHDKTIEIDGLKKDHHCYWTPDQFDLYKSNEDKVRERKEAFRGKV